MRVSGAAVSRPAQASGGTQVQRVRSLALRAALPDILELAGAANTDVGRAEHADHHRTRCERYNDGDSRVLLSYGHGGGEFGNDERRNFARLIDR